MDKVANHNYEDSEKWGKVVTKDVDLPAFDRLDLRGVVRLEYTQDSVRSVQVYGNEKAIEAYDLAVKNGELVASLTKSGTNVDENSARITLRVRAPQLLKATCSGASLMAMENFVQQEDLRVVVSGAGDVELTNCTMKNLEVSINGAGKVAFKDVKATEDAELYVSGAGDLAGNLATRDLKIHLSGAGESSLVIDSKDVDVACSGASSLSLTGHCHEINQSESGSSRVHIETLNTDVK